MQKGYKREGRGMAVLRCFIGLFIMIVVILLAYFMLQLDYSDKLDPSVSMRPYVEVTPSPIPAATAEPTEAPALPTEAPEEPPIYDPGEGEGENGGGEATIDPSSPQESISFV